MAHVNVARRDRCTAAQAMKACRERGAYLSREEVLMALRSSRRFEAWLQSFMATSTKTKSEAKRVITGVFRFYKFCDPTFQEDLLPLIKSMDSVNAWLVALQEMRLGPSGVQSLLKDLIFYLDWAEQDTLDTSEKERITEVKLIYRRICRRLNREKKAQMRWRREEENDIDWQAVIERFNVAHCRAVRRCSLLLPKRSSLQPEELVLLRRTVMLAMVRTNALRESAVYGLTMGEAGAARWSKDGRLFFFRVHNHKTGKTSGSVEVRLVKQEAELFLLYSQHRQELGTPKDEDAFFVQGRGSSMSTSLAIEFQKLATTLGLEGIPCPTRLRKAVQSLAPVETLRDREALAQLLHHSPTVAVAHYRRQTAEDKVVSRNLLDHVLTSESSPRTPAGAEEERRPRGLVDYSSDSESDCASESDRKEPNGERGRVDGLRTSETGIGGRSGPEDPGLTQSGKEQRSALARRKQRGPFSSDAIRFLRTEFADWLEHGLPHCTKKAIQLALEKGRDVIGDRDYRSVYFKLKALAGRQG